MHDLARAAAAHGPAFRRRLRQLTTPAERLHHHLVNDPHVAEQLERNALVVPLDKAATRAIRRLATDRDDVRVARPEDVGEAFRLGAPVSKVLGSGQPGDVRGGRARARLLVRAPGVGDTRRSAAARDVALAHLRGGDLDRAEQTTRAAARQIRDARIRADLLGDVTSMALYYGYQTALAQPTAQAELACADAVLQSSPVEAAASFTEAARTAFHPVLHMHHTSSPLAADPSGFVAAFAESATAQRLRRGRRHVEPAGARTEQGSRAVAQRQSAQRPNRLLMLHRGNDNFLGELERHLGDHPDFEVRVVDTATAAPRLNAYFRDVTRLAERLLKDPTALADEVTAQLGDDIAWADVVHVEWCTSLAALVPLAVPSQKRVVVRLHSYEAFTVWPHLVDFSAVDDLLFVSDHVRDLAQAAIPALNGPDAPRLKVLPLALHLRQFNRPKSASARHGVALIGWHKVVKDVRWALEVMRSLRKADTRYRLLLIGDDFEPSVSAATERYGEVLEVELRELEAAGAVRRYGRTDDVPAALAEVGVILSTSVRESFHAGLVEGAASGAVPVVRDWPYFAGRPNSARTLFPEAWVVASPQEAAHRILETTGDEATWRAVGAAAAEHVLSTWDWDVVQADYEDFFRPG